MYLILKKCWQNTGKVKMTLKLLTKTQWLLILPLLFITGCQAFASNGYEFKGAEVSPPLEIPDFQLMSATGSPFELNNLQGDIKLVYFGYTYCPDVCPLTLWEVKNALTQLENGQERVHVLFVSVDPERDTPDKLAKYTAAFGPQVIGLTDRMDNTLPVMQTFGASAEREEIPDYEGYTVSHSASLYLVDGQNRLLLQYPFGFTAKDLTEDLTYLLNQKQ